MNHYRRIRDLREDADKSQAEIASALYMQITQYGRYERGERELPFEVAIALAKYYNVSLDYLSGADCPKDRITDENELLSKFRSLSDFEKGQVFEKINQLNHGRINP